MFFLFWSGHRIRKEPVDSVAFYCPTCLSQQSYTRFALSRQFTIYSVIPIGKPEDMGTVTECNSCHNQYLPSVPPVSSPYKHSQATVWACPQCANYNPSDKASCLKCGHHRND